VLGPLLTTISLREYFASPGLYAYFLNITGDIHTLLPGVFAGNPHDHTTNAQLWTIPFELICYLILFSLALFGAYRRRSLVLAVAVVASLLPLLDPRFHVLNSPHHTITVPSFMWGIVLHKFGDKLRWNGVAAALAIASAWLACQFPETVVLAPFPVAYFTIYLGMLNPRKLWLLNTGDYSYGLYLYGFPIQQALYVLTPLARTGIGNVLLGIPVAFCFAFLSWHLVEKRALSLRKELYRLEAWVLRKTPRESARPI
jgi:peptidoglycan/LPS O-acetylase OafA/YrhL